MSVGVGDLVTHLVADTSQFSAGLASAQKQLSGFADNMTASVAGIVGGFAAIGTADFAMNFAVGAVQAAEEDAAAMRKFEAVLSATGGTAGVTSDEIGKLAEQLQLTTKFGDDATVAAAGLLATFKNISGTNFKETLRLAQDFAAVKDIGLPEAVTLLGKALNDPAEGMAKLERSGIQLSDQQKELVKSLAAAGDTAKAQAIILRELESTVGGAAEATVTASQRIANAIGVVQEKAGYELLPALELAAKGITEAQKKAADDAESGSSRLTKAYLRAAGEFAKQVFPILMFNDMLKEVNDRLEETPKKLKDIGDDIEVVFAAGAGGEEIKGWETAVKSIKDLQGELDIVTGAAKKSDVELKKMLDSIGNDPALDGLKEKLKGIHEQLTFEEEAKSLREALDKIGTDFEDSMKRQADSLRESLMTPEEKLQQKLQELKDLRDAGEINQEEFDKLSARLGESNKKTADNATDGVAAAMQGSVEAVSAIAKAVNGSNAPADKMVKEQQIANQWLEQIALRENMPAIELVAGDIA